MALYDDALGGDGGARSTRGQIRRVLRYVRTHLHEPLDVQTLADLARLSRAHFTRVFTHSGGGGTPTVYQGAFWAARAGLKSVPDLSMAQATFRRRSATER